MIKEMILFANHLDSKGLSKEADVVDSIIRKLSYSVNDELTKALNEAERDPYSYEVIGEKGNFSYKITGAPEGKENLIGITIKEQMPGYDILEGRLERLPIGQESMSAMMEKILEYGQKEFEVPESQAVKQLKMEIGRCSKMIEQGKLSEENYNEVYSKYEAIEDKINSLSVEDKAALKTSSYALNRMEDITKFLGL